VIVNLIASASTRAGLKIEAEYDAGVYPTGLQITDNEFEKLGTQGPNCFGVWNYTIIPQRHGCAG